MTPHAAHQFLALVAAVAIGGCGAKLPTPPPGTTLEAKVAGVDVKASNHGPWVPDPAPSCSVVINVSAPDASVAANVADAGGDTRKP